MALIVDDEMLVREFWEKILLKRRASESNAPPPLKKRWNWQRKNQFLAVSCG